MAKVAKSKSNAVLKDIDFKYMGPEPVLGIINSSNDMVYSRALSWYNYHFGVDKAKEWLLDYMTKNKYDKQIISAVRKSDKNNTSTTIGWMARMMMNGATLSEKSMEWFKVKINENANIQAVPSTTSTNVVDIQGRIRAKSNSFIARIEVLVDEGTKPALYEMFTAEGISKPLVESVFAYYQPIAAELNSDDPQVKEAYGSKLKLWKSIYNAILEDCEKFLNNKKLVKVRKPRETKTKSSVDVVKLLKYKKQDIELKMASIQPSELVGSQSLWVFNTKYRKLAVYMASGPAGLSVKGTSIIGFDEALSKQKTLRKPTETIDALMKSGKVTLRKFMDTIKSTESIPNGRINAETILLKVTR
jgi:hypothetical protein